MKHSFDTQIQSPLRLIRRRIELPLFIILTGFVSLPAHATLTKETALKLMQANGVRWKQTHLLIDDAQALSQMADAALKPRAQFVGSEFVTRADLSRFTDQNGPLNIVNYGALVAQVDVPLLDRKSLSRSEAAKAGVTVSQQQSEQYRSDLTAGMVLTYLNAQRMAEKIRVIKANIERDGEIVKMAESKVNSGVGITMDLMRAQGLVAFEQMKLLDAQTSYKKAVQDLSILLGQTKLDDDLEPLIMHEISIDADDPFAKTGIDDRPDVKVSLETLRAARLLRDEAKNEWFPTLSAFGEGGVGASNLFPNAGPQAVGLVGLQIKAPFLDGGYLSGKETQAQINITKAELQAKHVRLEADGQIKEALEQLKTSKAAASLAVEQVELATKELEIARKRFQTGATSGADLATSQSNLSNAFINRIDVITAYEASKVGYYRSIGDLEAYFQSESQTNGGKSNASVLTIPARDRSLEDVGSARAPASKAKTK